MVIKSVLPALLPSCSSVPISAGLAERAPQARQAGPLAVRRQLRGWKVGQFLPPEGQLPFKFRRQQSSALPQRIVTVTDWERR
jgi:hypothetical protein